MPDATAAVSEVVETLRKATISGDREVLDRLTADELVYGHTSGRAETKAEFIEGVTSGKSGFSEITLSDQTVTVIDQLAVVRHSFLGTRRNVPGDSQRQLAIMMVWLRQQERWRLIARQAVFRK